MIPVQVGWLMAMCFIIVLLLIIFAWNDRKLGNPFAPFIRAYESRQKHRQAMARIRLRAELTRSGVDPAYIKVLEKEEHGPA